ncbi:MAG: NADH-quinone oxidoreductase subunit C [Deltaproteobacteria bacterium]|nr:NADH-quinone oxidoreductase subunit C [Deltaproteobacteria bacterium]
MISDKLDKIIKNFGTYIAAIKEEKGERTILVKPEAHKELLRFLRYDEEMSYDMLIDLCGVDYLGENPRFEVVYLLRSMRDGDRLRVKVRLNGEDEIETVSDLWRAADWLERETYDMFGIRFRNHPDLRRILLSDDFSGHPLRKDFPAEGFDFDKPFEVKLEEEI